jgi:hypothetical protein
MWIVVLLHAICLLSTEVSARIGTSLSSMFTGVKVHRCGCTSVRDFSSTTVFVRGNCLKRPGFQDRTSSHARWRSACSMNLLAFTLEGADADRGMDSGIQTHASSEGEKPEVPLFVLFTISCTMGTYSGQFVCSSETIWKALGREPTLE